MAAVPVPVSMSSDSSDQVIYALVNKAQTSLTIADLYIENFDIA